MTALDCGPVAGVGLLGSATAFPPGGRWVANPEIHELLHGPDWPAEMRAVHRDPAYVEDVLGFSRRYWTHTPGTEPAPNELGTDDLMHAAGRSALADAGCSADEIDLFIAVSTTPPRVMTSLGTLVGGMLDLGCAAFEMRSGCASSAYALAVAYQFLAGGARRVLIASAETPSKYTPASSLAYAMGDAAAAVVLGHVDDANRGLRGAHLDSDGHYAGRAGVAGPLPPTTEAISNREYQLVMPGDLESVTAEKWVQAPKALFADCDVTPGDLDAYVPNQVSRRTIRAGASAAGINDDRIVDRVAEYANCGSASMLTALHDARRDGRITDRSLVMVNTVGGGIAWAGLLFVP